MLILTSVVPPELPMQTALAVNTALMALMKAQVRYLVISPVVTQEGAGLLTAHH